MHAAITQAKTGKGSLVTKKSLPGLHKTSPISFVRGAHMHTERALKFSNISNQLQWPLLTFSSVVFFSPHYHLFVFLHLACNLMGFNVSIKTLWNPPCSSQWHQGLCSTWEAGLFITAKAMQVTAWWPFLSVTIAFKQLLADLCFQYRAYMAMEETWFKEQVWAKNQSSIWMHSSAELHEHFHLHAGCRFV